MVADRSAVAAVAQRRMSSLQTAGTRACARRAPEPAPSHNGRGKFVDTHAACRGDQAKAELRILIVLRRPDRERQRRSRASL